MQIRQINSNNTGINKEENIPGYRHEDGLYFSEDFHKTYCELAKTIYNFYPNVKKILELGSGAGSLSYHLRNINKKYLIVTLDGNKETVNSPFIEQTNHFVVRTDEYYELINKKNNLIKFDLILSFEHFEHISKDTFNVFIKNILKHSKNGTVILATAANWHEGWESHINLQDKDKWDNLFHMFGFHKLDLNFVNHKNIPFNFSLDKTIQLSYIYNEK